MKNYAKSYSLMLVLVLLTMCFAACGKDEDQKASSLVGGKTYAFESCTVDGEDVTETFTAMYSEQSFSFKDDGTCVQTIIWAEEMAEALGTDPVKISGTYTEKEKTITATFVSDEGDVVMEFTVDGDTLTMNDEGSIMVYKLKSNS